MSKKTQAEPAAEVEEILDMVDPLRGSQSISPELEAEFAAQQMPHKKRIMEQQNNLTAPQYEPPQSINAESNRALGGMVASGMIGGALTGAAFANAAKSIIPAKPSVGRIVHYFDGNFNGKALAAIIAEVLDSGNVHLGVLDPTQGGAPWVIYKDVPFTESKETGKWGWPERI